MLTIIIGHRGVGKTYFLNQLKTYFQKNKIPAGFFDLDKEIEKSSKKNIFELLTKNKSDFRKWEQKTFQKILKSLKLKNNFISVGAGFTFDKKYKAKIIYLFRESDKEGRVFLNRPALTNLPPLKEWEKFYKKRSCYYLQQANTHFYRREHFKKLQLADLVFLGLKDVKTKCFSYRLYPDLLPKDKKLLKQFLQKRLKWGIRFFELNDQDSSVDFIKKIQSLLPSEKILFSSQKTRKFLKIKNKRNWSWDLSLGPAPKGVNILSLHKRNSQSLKSILKSFSKYKNYHLKLAVEIYNLKELKMAHDWWKKDPRNRSFLPRSLDGKWIWFRQAFGPQMLLHFIKEQQLTFSKYKKQDVLDQPFLSSALPFVKGSKKWAGILAKPAKTLATPYEQHNFFCKKHSIPVLALELEQKEITKNNLHILSQLGFIFFAVSSPLKKRAFLMADQKDSPSQKLKTSNTLIFHNKKWKAFNTDWNGMEGLKKYSKTHTVVWGGGGTRPVLKKILPLALFYSARTGQNLSSQKIHPKKSPKILIWAVGRKRMSQACQFPPKHWKPKLVVDLNYTEDSPGREYALKIKSKYQSGWSFFKRQAKKQRDIFKKLYKLG